MTIALLGFFNGFIEKTQSVLCLICVFTALKKKEMAIYLLPLKNWPSLQWDEQVFISLLSEVRNLYGNLALSGFQFKDEVNLEILIQDVIETSEIEGEILSPEFVSNLLVRWKRSV